MVTIQAVHQTLHEIFRFSSFRGDQEAIIRRLSLDRQSALVLMPTGMGKSLCYQLPARLLYAAGEGMTLVISPLIALMKDQVDAAVKKGLKAAFINSSLSGDERRRRYAELARGEFELLYVTPERFRVPEFRQSLLGQRVALLAVDEAHCISSWGHDFRPDYSRLGDIRHELGDPLTLALTATATPQVRNDILLQLRLTPHTTAIFDHGIRRDELALSVLDVHGSDEKVRALVAFRHRFSGPAIVYFSLVQTLTGFSQAIARLGVEHEIYHGKLHDRERRRAQERFLASADGLILATPAFGLGVDKDNVRLVMHAEMPGSIEAYYQEVGRAGRDGAPAAAVLLLDEDDITIQADFLRWANPDPGFVRTVFNLIARNLLRSQQEGFEFLRGQMNFYNRRDFRVETAVNQLERWGAIEGLRPRDWQVLGEPPAEYLDERLYEARMQSQRLKLEQMVGFCQMTNGCRMAKIANYFGSSEQLACGVCDLCEAGGRRAGEAIDA